MGQVSNDLPWSDYWQYFAPSYQLHADLRGKDWGFPENHNTQEYLDKVLPAREREGERESETDRQTDR